MGKQQRCSMNPPAYPVTTAPTGMLLTTYTYDQLNHLTQVSMPRSTGTQTRTFVYNSTNQFLTSVTDPENGTVSYTYNSDGTLASKTYANTNYETYNYDSYQRLTAIHRFPDGGSEDLTQLQSFTYDTLGSASYPGYLVAASFANTVGSNQLSFQYQYAYTPAGKVTNKTLLVESANHNSAASQLAVGYSYDNLGTMQTVSFGASASNNPPTSWTAYAYSLDALDRPIGMNDSTGLTWASGVTYNPANQITALKLQGPAPWAVVESRAYNSLNQLTQIQQKGDNAYYDLLNMTYTYSSTQNNGQITQSADAVTGETITYQYDALKRLLSATSTGGSQAWSESYGYDGFGNLTQMTPTGGAPSLSVAVNAGTNQILPTGVTYGANGNVTATASLGTITYVANRMVTVNGLTYAYDPANHRVFDSTSNGYIYLYFATDDTFEYDGHKVKGLKLPRSVLKKVYHDNAVHWVPGIDANSR
jgi:YD repeat-containing protein